MKARIPKSAAFALALGVFAIPLDSYAKVGLLFLQTRYCAELHQMYEEALREAEECRFRGPAFSECLDENLRATVLGLLYIERCGHKEESLGVESNPLSGSEMDDSIAERVE